MLGSLYYVLIDGEIIIGYDNFTSARVKMEEFIAKGEKNVTIRRMS